MNKKLLISLLLIGVLAFGAGLGTMAWFTNSSSSANNVFQTGTLAISGPANKDISSTFDVGNIYPTWSDSKTITVKNTGSLPFKYRVSVSSTRDTLLYKGEDGLRIQIGDGPQMPLNQLVNYDLGVIAAGEQGLLNITFSLPATANNQYQALKDSFTFTFEATQVNAPWETNNPDPVDPEDPEDPADPIVISDETMIKDWNVRIERAGVSHNYNAFVSGRLVNVLKYDNDDEEISYPEGVEIEFTYVNGQGNNRTAKATTGADGKFNIKIDGVHQRNSNITPVGYEIVE
ncbi:SipW-dependent-type signal peptide-containing protein [Alkaliphilus transvaalensis]|uniref:SipW-dependent-type signal peptide-containing protein n=1 Tax=Alkaliphilus transvaalensis TaxID=114628 RepID=UPI000479EB03|nr:SipW-dependent-type signal peptide-containing protein [Alkaliphilus transvaalensis]